MKTLLIFPPSSDPAHPPLGICSLAGYLRGFGENVSLLDLNILSYLYLLSKGNIAYCSDRINKRINKLESSLDLLPNNFEEYRLLVENSMSAEYLWKKVDDAIKNIKNPESYHDHNEYMKNSAIIRRSMEFVSAAHYPVRWYPRGFSMSYLPTNSIDVLAAITDNDQNIFLPIYNRYMQKIIDLNPNLIGISLNYYSQMIPSLTLAFLIKRKIPKSFIVIGGGLICFFEDNWNILKSFNTIVDGWIPFEGEEALLQLIQAIHSEQDIKKALGLIYYNGSDMVYNQPAPPPDIKKLPPPSFDDLPLNEYLSPKMVLPVLSSRGCYWNRCAFCSHGQLYRGHYRAKEINQLFQEIKFLSEKYNTDCFYFTDESMSPSTAIALSNKIAHNEICYSWFSEIRFENSLNYEMLIKLRDGGCKMLMFGLESGVSRVLKLMNKGIQLDEVTRILKDCYHVGIRTFVMFFVGFPTETIEEASMTIQFIEKLNTEITHIAFTNFILEHKSNVYHKHLLYGINEVLPYEDEDLKIYSRYVVDNGMTSDEAIDFLNECKERPVIKSLVSTYLVSRSHLIFLKQKRNHIMKPEISRLNNIPNSKTVYPLRHPDLIYKTYSFNLNEIRGRLNNSVNDGMKPLKNNPTTYIINPELEKLIEISKDGVLMLKFCNGQFSIDQILSLVKQNNRKAAMKFLNEMAKRNFIHLGS